MYNPTVPFAERYHSLDLLYRFSSTCSFSCSSFLSFSSFSSSLASALLRLSKTPFISCSVVDSINKLQKRTLKRMNARQCVPTQKNKSICFTLLMTNNILYFDDVIFQNLPKETVNNFFLIRSATIFYKVSSDLSKQKKEQLPPNFWGEIELTIRV